MARPPSLSSSPPPPSSDAPQQQSTLLTSSLISLTFLVALQLFSRLFTSILNQALFRLVSPSAFGTAAIQFELVLGTILFLSREGVRGAILRSGKSRANPSGVDATAAGSVIDDDEATKQSNLTFLPILLGVPLALVTSFVYLTLASGEVRAQKGLLWAVVVYAGAAVLELGSEPMHNRAMVELKTDVRVRAEGMGITAKSCMTLLVLFLDAQRFKGKGEGEWALVAFALGQLAYAAVVWGAYVRAFGVPWLRRPKGTSGYFDPALLSLSVTMTLQSVIKHVLTEGDKLMLTFFSPLQDQGGYAIAANYGSLLARIVFQPLEETLRVFFSKLLAPSSSSEPPSSKPKKEGLRQASDALTSLLSVQFAFSVLFVIFGRAYLGVFLPLLLPKRYLETSAPRVLEAWVFYIPVLAVNGGLEAFLASAASTKDLNRQSRWMFAFSVIYVSTAMGLYRLGFGDVSLIYANSVNLSARIVYCLIFASRFFNNQQHVPGASSGSDRSAFSVHAVVPPLPFLVASAVAAVLVRVSAKKWGVGEKMVGSGAVRREVLIHVGFGGVLGVVCLGMWWVVAGRKLKVRGMRRGSSGKVD